MTVIVVTGIQAAGKSTIAQALAERLVRSVHVRGDLFRRMVVNGREEMGSAQPSAEAVRQLQLRYALAATVAAGYAEAGFTVVLQDIILGEDLVRMVDRIRSRPRYVVVLAPRPEAVQAREDTRRAERGKVAYKPGDEGVVELDAYLRRETPGSGCGLIPLIRQWLRQLTRSSPAYGRKVRSDQTGRCGARGALSVPWLRPQGRPQRGLCHDRQCLDLRPPPHQVRHALTILCAIVEVA
ncbi:AAA family ATPase [Catellatospora sp. NPDC049609]|uniref:AAA family ATPase n=1 Tax=Catellatospora sp. NPDC049609 TaxID=3155505 RepID=UPI00342A77C0